MSTSTAIPPIHVTDPEKLGLYWVELRSMSALELKSLTDPQVHPAEERRLSQPYSLPYITLPSGPCLHPVTVTQTGLADYTRFKATGDRRFFEHSRGAGDWLLANQSQDGSWRYDFDFEEMRAGWSSAMGQGQAVSLLVRLYVESADSRYLSAAQRAYRFMTRPSSEGGPMGAFEDGSPVPEEYPGAELNRHVLNGALFAAWGVRDLALATQDGAVMRRWEAIAASLGDHLHEYDTGGWSSYSLPAGGRPSPVNPDYHRLHIAQLRVMYAMTGRTVWRQFADRWQADLVEWASAD